MRQSFRFYLHYENLLLFSCKVVSDPLWPHGLWPSRLLCPWDSPGKNTGVGCHFLLQGIFQTQGLNPCLLHWQSDSLSLSHQGSPQSKNIMLSFSTTGLVFSKIYQAFATHISLLVLGNFKFQGAESDSEDLRQKVDGLTHGIQGNVEWVKHWRGVNITVPQK